MRARITFASRFAVALAAVAAILLGTYLPASAHRDAAHPAAGAASSRVGAVVARLKHDRKLRGVIHRKDFTFDTRTVYDISRTLTVLASGTVRVRGPIRLGRRAALTIRARAIVVTAPIGPQPPVPGEPGAHRPPVCPAPGISLQASGPITIRASITAANGGTESNGDGCRGGNIGIRSRTKISIGAAVHSGDGGPGDTRHVTEGAPGTCRGPSRPTKVETGSGGPGGFIAISGSAAGALLNAPAAELHAGDGGDGGDVGTSEHPISGTPTPDDRSGLSLVAVTGNGGDGGDILVGLEGKPLTHPGTPGRGGRAGSAFLSPGDGGATNCNGGHGTALLGRNGHGGQGTLRAGPIPVVEVEFERGGNGDGAAASPSDPTGGNGGIMTVRLDPNPRPGATALPEVRVRARDAANGGSGFDGCAQKPQAAGGPGGNGGQLIVGTLPLEGASADHAFNGGDGGKGSRHGTGGEAGVTNLAQVSRTIAFLPGDPGVDCPGAGHFGTWTDTATHNYICVYLKGAAGQQGDVQLEGATAQTPPPGLVSTNPVPFTLDSHGHALAKFTVDYGGYTYHYSVLRRQPDGTLKGGEDDQLFLPFGGNGDHGPAPSSGFNPAPCGP